MTTPFGINNAKQISVLTTDQLADTNHTRTDHLLFLATNIGPKEITISIKRLGDNIIVEDNQARSSIDRRGNGNRDLPFGSWKSGNKMSVDFGRNMNDKIGMNPLRTI